MWSRKQRPTIARGLSFCCFITTLHPFNGLFSRTTYWVSQHQKGKPSWVLVKQEMMGWQWHQLDHMQIICTSLQTTTPPHNSVFTGQMPFLSPNQRRQNTEGSHFSVVNFCKTHNSGNKCFNYSVFTHKLVIVRGLWVKLYCQRWTTFQGHRRSHTLEKW